MSRAALSLLAALAVFVAIGTVAQTRPEVPPPRATDETLAQTRTNPPAPKSSDFPDYKTMIYLWHTNAEGRSVNFLLSGNSQSINSKSERVITPFQMKSFHGSNELQLIGRAPECHINEVQHRGWDSSHIVLFTPTSNVWVQGDGYMFLETNRLLFVSNNVETRIVRSLLKSSMLGSAPTNAPGASNQPMKIFSDWAVFNAESNTAQYFGHVHVIDFQLDVVSKKLFIQLGTNSTVQSMVAEEEVVLTTTNKGWAAGPKANYYVTNGVEMMNLNGGAVWHNGDEQAWADEFIYDSTHHLLTGIGNVKVWWPNAPQKANEPPKVDEHGYRKLFADFAALQWPLTNGPIETMHATGSVAIANQDDDSRATGDTADYSRARNLFQLNGNPMWWKDEMKIHGRVLTADATNKTYHAHGDALLEQKVGGASHTNEWLKIAADDIDSETNATHFKSHVVTRLFDDGVLKDTLYSDTLDLDLISNAIKTATARGHVTGETAPDKLGRFDTISCDTLIAHNDTVAKMLTDIVAHDHVILRQLGTNAGVPTNQVASDLATAYFSQVMTNQVERAVAEHHVVIDSFRTNQTLHATGEKADYAVPLEEAKLTGHPLANDGQHFISDALYLTWLPKAGRFRAFGTYQIVSHPANK